jgi:hypothetical protein
MTISCAASFHLKLAFEAKMHTTANAKAQSDAPVGDKQGCRCTVTILVSDRAEPKTLCILYPYFLRFLKTPAEVHGVVAFEL